jgi:MFS family permease
MPLDGINTTPGAGLQPSGTLLSRTYVGLLIAQFLAAFNDQAIHASAMFFAINTQTLNEAQAISLMPILFYAPWAIFCTIAGYLADRYSKKYSLVFWKFAELAITGLALFGFWLGTHGGMPRAGAWLVLSTVFLMGTHSAFFVPAKYGVMPEILQAQLLSRGNGLLESLSFLAVILGTVAGGVLSYLFLRQEWVIGIILFALAVVGALASLLIRYMPAANPQRALPAYIFGPLWNNLKTLIRSRPLAFAVVGIAFFTFIVAFMRATVYMFGESQNPRWDELRTSVVVGTVALGIGLGSPLAGWLSGRKVELGLIPLGATGMIVGCSLAAMWLDNIPGLVACIVLIGFSTGFYLVPLFTLLQYRAPKTSKGDMIATSNFINVTGAIAASVLFAALVGLAKKAEFVPKVPEQDNYVRGELVRLDLHRGRPVYFEVQPQGGGALVAVGHKPNPEEPMEPVRIWKHIFGNGNGHGLPTIHARRGVAARVIDSEEGHKPGTAVVVSHFTIRGVEHFAIRPEGTPPADHYDAQHLPRFLFLGAGLMTLCTLFVLWGRLPDLLQRAGWLIRSFGAGKLQINGLQNLPGYGPVILITNASDARARRRILSVTDRYTRFLPAIEKAVPEAVRLLQRGHMVAVELAEPELETFLRLVQGTAPAELVPVFCERTNAGVRLAFGEKVMTATPGELRERMAAAGMTNDPPMTHQ